LSVKVSPAMFAASGRERRSVLSRPRRRTISSRLSPQVTSVEMESMVSCI